MASLHGTTPQSLPSNSDRVGATNWLGGRTETEYLLSPGHRRIAIISGDGTLRCSRDRIAGYRAALEDAAVPVIPELIRPGAFVQQTGYKQTCALLDLPEPPTAIFAGSDTQAMGVYSALRSRGLSIPDNMSVVGFDDVSIASAITPALTTVRQPLVEMGRVATTMLLRLIAEEPLDSKRVELTTSLIIRESCAPLYRALNRYLLASTKKGGIWLTRHTTYDEKEGKERLT